MPSITIELPDDLAARIRNHGERVAEILELGLREWNAGSQNEFQSAAEVLEFLAGLPTPEDTLALRASASMQMRVQELVEKTRAEGLSAQEQEEWDRYEYLEHLVRMAKAAAQQKLS